MLVKGKSGIVSARLEVDATLAKALMECRRIRLERERWTEMSLAAAFFLTKVTYIFVLINSCKAGADTVDIFALVLNCRIQRTLCTMKNDLGYFRAWIEFQGDSPDVLK